MSAIIERGARNVRNLISGDGKDNPASRRVAAQDSRGGDLLRQFATGGLALGAGAGALVVLTNYLKALKKERELNDASRLNDDTLYVPTLKKSSSTALQELEDETGSAPPKGVNRWLAPGLAVTGGILSGALAYQLVNMAYNRMMRRRRQEMLDKAQGEALVAADIELGKAAGTTKMTFTDWLTAFPVAVPLLAALASGGVAYAALKKSFPVVKTPKSKYPKRIRQVAESGEMTDITDEVKKSASAREIYAEDDCEAAAREFLILVTDSVAHEKRASVSITSDVLNRAAKDGVGGLVDVLSGGGIEGLVESVKGASRQGVSWEDKLTGAALICKSARLAPVVSFLAAAEFNDLLPGISAMVSQQDEDHIDKMAGLGALMQLSFYRPGMLGKEALMKTQLLEELQQFADTPKFRSHTYNELEDMDESLTSDAAGSLAEDAEGEDDESDSLLESSEDESQSVDDSIDVFMEDPRQDPLLGG